ncbi:uncharacterized protein F4807DRAFT_219513 [Annulohypoxylon truncatum]|uniref:uncharacterized protein n=1 Tax=Annulohypoxylon truncatum TaxID=327061 RepID=UPI002007961C|nr:uncharacterized protein F4807DRAFT_219513 [Annulohypoxylon truncatum]KAI1206663.1 hypothetical protein F4807DRAFT_219513 [Annulohypoxylon truncatum]
MSSPAHLPAPRRITASNLPLAESSTAKAHSEPGVEVLVDSLPPDPIMGGVLMRARVASSKRVPTSNDGHGNLALDDVPGMGIVLPGGLNMYYLDIAPNSEGVMHRTTSTDYLVVLNGTLSLLTPAKPFDVIDGKPTYGEPVETLCNPGDVVLQRGIAHALSNRSSEWVRVMAIVLASEPNRVPVTGSGPAGQSETSAALDDIWLQ